MMYGTDWGSGWGWMMVLMPLLWIALTAVIVWAVLKVAQRPATRYPANRGGRRQQEILDRRFAAGEIDAAAYTEAKAHLATRDVHSQ